MHQEKNQTQRFTAKLVEMPLITSSNQEKEEQKSGSLPSLWIETIFKKFEGIFGHLWTSRHADLKTWEITKDEWAKGLYGISGVEIKSGLIECRHLKFAPSLGEFRDLCIKSKNIPDEYETYCLAIRRNFQNPFVKLAYSKIADPFAFHQRSERESRKLFSPAYAHALKEYRTHSGQKQIECDKMPLELPVTNDKNYPLPNSGVNQETATYKEFKALMGKLNHELNPDNLKNGEVA